jgi:hypothetical protein
METKQPVTVSRAVSCLHVVRLNYYLRAGESFQQFLSISLNYNVICFDVNVYLVKDIRLFFIIVIIIISGVGLTSPGTAATSGLLYSPK